MVLEIIKGNKIEVSDTANISAVEAAALLGMSRQWVSALMKHHVNSGKNDTIPCVVIGGRYFTTEKQLRDYYDGKVKKFVNDPRK